MKEFLNKFKYLLAGIALAVSIPVGAQLIYGNTFPFWTVNGPLVVTGVSTLSGGTTITGTTTNDSAAAGVVGQYTTYTVASGASGAGTTAFLNSASGALTAGDWDVYGSCDLDWTGVTATVVNCGVSTASATLTGQSGIGNVMATDPTTKEIATFGTTLTGTKVVNTPIVRMTLATATTVYIVTGMTYSAGSYVAYGTLKARRVR